MSQEIKLPTGGVLRLNDVVHRDHTRFLVMWRLNPFSLGCYDLELGFMNRNQRPSMGDRSENVALWILDQENVRFFNPHGMQVLNSPGDDVELKQIEGSFVLVSEAQRYLNSKDIQCIQDNLPQILEWAKGTEWLELIKASVVSCPTC